MKRFIAYAVLVLMSIGCYAQDIIVKKDGSIIQAKIIKIGTAEVDYKKWSNQDGPSYAIAKSDVLAITYQNGEKESFGEEQSSKNQQSEHEPLLVSRQVSTDNADVVSRYRKNIHLRKPEKIGKDVKSAVGVFAFSENSVLSNEDLEIRFLISQCESPSMTPFGTPIFKKGTYLLFRYSIAVENKTDKTLYFDLANCSRSNKKTMDSYAFYSSESVSVSRGNSTTVGIGAGLLPGVGVGLAGSSSASSTRSYTQDRIVSVPPRGVRMLKDFKVVQVKSDKCELISKGEEFIFGFTDGSLYPDFGMIEQYRSGMHKGVIKENEIINYTYENSPIVLDYRFTYSSLSDFSKFSVITSNLYLSTLVGIPTFLYSSWLSIRRAGKKSVVDMLDGYDESTICGPIFLER